MAKEVRVEETVTRTVEEVEGGSEAPTKVFFPFPFC
jgi:hypothetical protein